MAGGVTGIISLLLLLSAFLPLSRQLTSNDIDWPILLDELHGRDVAFGRDVVFTFGPWGFVWAAASPGTLPIACVVWAGFALVVWMVLGRIAMAGVARSPLWVGGILVLLALPLGGDYVLAPDVRLLLLPFLLVLYHVFVEPRGGDWVKLVLVSAIAVAGLIKFTCFVAGAMAMGIVTIDQLLRREWRVVPLLTWVGATLLAWLLAGQSLVDLAPWIRHSLAMTAGYAEMMSLRSANEARQVMAFLLPAMGFVLLFAQTALRTAGRRGWLIVAGMILLLLIVFRCGYVRHDQHELISTMLLLEVIGLTCLIAWPRFRSRKEVVPWGICLAVAILGTSQSLSDWNASSLPREIGRTIRNVGEEALELARLTRGEPSMIITQRQEQLDQFTARSTFPSAQGNADLYPRLSIALMAHEIAYAPRPTLQSYAATTPALTALNASHLSGPNAPEHLFIDTSPTSEHLSPLLDNRSWREMLGRYRLERPTGSHLHLVRQDQAITLESHQIHQATVPLGRRFDLPTEAIPADAMLWAQIEVHRSAFGSLVAQLYKPPSLSISIVTADGQSGRWRFVPSLGADGFLIGPLITDEPTLAAALADQPDFPSLAGRMPRSITIGVVGDPHGHWHYHQDVVIRLFRLEQTGR